MYTLHQIQQRQGCTAQWQRYNVRTGHIDTLTGTIHSAGTLPQCANTEYVVITDSAGRRHITTPAQVKNIIL